MTPTEVRMVVRRTVDRFGTVQAADMAGVSCRDIRAEAAVGMMQCLDLFSCVGCHALGMSRAGVQTVGFVEVNEFRRQVLADRFPGVPIHDDIRTYHGRRGAADIVTGGPPCQRTSVAAAIHGRRDGGSLWSEMLRACNDIRPEWIVVEQPPGHAAWEAEVAEGLRRSGWHSARVEFSAFDIGAPYLRRRVFILACASLPRLEVAWRSIPRQIERVTRTADARGDWNASKLRSVRVDASSAGEMDGGAISRLRRERIEALGDSNPPGMMEVIARAIVEGAQA